ncbi:GNAT family N-acetyltransferase [Sneathiella chinensis]|uniref:N-acetyltransferase domain-containing protein n=1 Tax=Sneathiella chinensis TaxID=349750 RepID=A0ABQ5TZ44_9PROT|nr:GNAT family N-acetyltransferase [Sneathiella chinensis]GLQ05145.1 hypothetical protein GCM10007924_03660 [Sneathiella chinensis]
MSGITIRLAEAEDVPAIDTALRKLSDHLGDTHVLRQEELGALLFQEPIGIRVLLAETAGKLVGVVMFSSYVSTTAGGLGVYVSDLWVDASVRGQGIGPRLLVAILDLGPFPIKTMFLNVYQDNIAARKTYLRLGFKANSLADDLSLDESDFHKIRGKV